MPNEQCPTGIRLTEKVTNLEEKATANDHDHEHLYELIDRVRNRLPAWATLVIGVLMAIIGLLGGLAL